MTRTSGRRWLGLGGMFAAVALAGTCMMAAPASAQAAQYLYKDTYDTEWYVTEGWLDYVTDSRIMTGYTTGPDAGGFRPDATITRGEVVTVLYRIANPDSTATTNPDDFAATSGFDDGNYSYYWNAAIRWASDKGIVTGYTTGADAGKFVPDRNITRAELATMVYRFAKAMGADVTNVDDSAFMACADDPFLDPGTLLDYAREPMIWAADRGVITSVIAGDGSRWLDPQESATRAQAAKVFTVSKRDIVERSGSYTVTFNSNGGTQVATQTVTSGNKATRAFPTRDGYQFMGWFIDKELAKEYLFDSAVTGNTTLYAKWEPVADAASLEAADAVVGAPVDETVEATVDEATEPAVDEAAPDAQDPATGEPADPSVDQPATDQPATDADDAVDVPADEPVTGDDVVSDDAADESGEQLPSDEGVAGEGVTGDPVDEGMGDEADETAGAADVAEDVPADEAPAGELADAGASQADAGLPGASA